MECPKCRNGKLVKAGYDYDKTGKHQRYECCKCHAVTTKPIINEESLNAVER